MYKLYAAHLQLKATEMNLVLIKRDSRNLNAAWPNISCNFVDGFGFSFQRHNPPICS